jgi:hypothetical protein
MGASVNAYREFLERKSHIGGYSGFDPLWLPDFLYDFQKALVQWSVRKGKALVAADCGLGKTPMQLVWSENVARKTNGRILIITPLAVSAQTIREGQKFGIECHQSRDGKVTGRITVTNYERLHYFNPSDFSGVVCDESSAIKHFSGSHQREVTKFMNRVPYRLLCTATAAPNDFIELGTSAEALGEMGRMDMLSTFFKNDENSLRPIWWGARWRFKPYAEKPFWRWVCSWARALRKPSDLGFDDGPFVLPPLDVRQTIVKRTKPLPGFLFTLPAVTLADQRTERRATMEERCATVAAAVNANSTSLVWCHLNQEGDLLERLIPGAVQVKGGDPDEAKEERLLAFADGHVKALVTKPRIAGFGLNLQVCHHMTFFPSHSFEQYYQGVRRCWRFGQTQTVTVDIVTTEGEIGVLKNVERKSRQADQMFARLVADMNNELRMSAVSGGGLEPEMPGWL